MKKIIPALLFLLLFATACNKNAGTVTTTINERVDTVAAVIVTTTVPGNFISYGQGVNGTAKVYTTSGKLSLALENFSTNNGPDLQIGRAHV